MRKFILSITLFASLAKNNVSAQSWSPVGDGIGSAYYHSVYTSVIYNGELYVGGYFNTAGNAAANNIAKWNGVNWSSPGYGINGEVHFLAIYNGELYAGGSFSSVDDGLSAYHIAKWNGANWSAVGSGIDGAVSSLTVYNGELYAGMDYYSFGNSSLTLVAKWNGNSWTDISTGLSSFLNSVSCLAVYNNQLYVAGSYIGDGGVAIHYSIVKWNGLNWDNVVTMPASYTPDGALGGILSMAVYNGELYVAGSFSMIDTIPAYHIARWSGTNWSAVGSGINSEAYPFGGDSDGAAYSFVKSLAVFNGALYATGRFNSCGTIATTCIAKWDGNNWSGLGQGLNGYGYSLTASDTCLFVAGWFNYAGGYNNVLANNIAEWKESCIAAPSQPGIIHGNSSVCPNTQQTFFVNEIPGASSYTWTLPPGWTGNSPTNNITATAATNGGIISVVANNNCGASIPQTLMITSNSIPSRPLFINGNDSVCEGSSQTYFIEPVPGATGYAWDLTFGWAGGLNSDSITISVENSGYPCDVISVSAYNNCGYSDLQVLPVKVDLLPYKTGAIIGDATVCRGSHQTYFVEPVYNATSYTWMLPKGWTGNSNSSSIDAIAGSETGEILVRANNSCGSGPFTSLPVLPDKILLKPGDIKGNVNVTQGQIHAYSIDLADGASGYNWSLNGGGNIINGHSTNKIEVSWQTPGTYVLSANALNSCGESPDQSLTIKVAAANDDDPYNLQIFPNPSMGEFYLNAKGVQDKWINVEVVSISGQRIFCSGKKQGTNDYSQMVNLKKMPQGLYVVKITMDDKIFEKRIAILQ